MRMSLLLLGHGKRVQRLPHLALEMLMLRCLAPEASAVINGRLISVLVLLESSHLAFSAASLNRCTANLSPVRSIPCTQPKLSSSVLCTDRFVLQGGLSTGRAAISEQCTMKVA